MILMMFGCCGSGSRFVVFFFLVCYSIYAPTLVFFIHIFLKILFNHHWLSHDRMRAAVALCTIVAVDLAIGR